jgi:hypothetical protein
MIVLSTEVNSAEKYRTGAGVFNQSIALATGTSPSERSEVRRPLECAINTRSALRVADTSGPSSPWAVIDWLKATPALKRPRTFRFGLRGDSLTACGSLPFNSS